MSSADSLARISDSDHAWRRTHHGRHRTHRYTHASRSPLPPFPLTQEQNPHTRGATNQPPPRHRHHRHSPATLLHGTTTILAVAIIAQFTNALVPHPHLHPISTATPAPTGVKFHPLRVPSLSASLSSVTLGEVSNLTFPFFLPLQVSTQTAPRAHEAAPPLRRTDKPTHNQPNYQHPRSITWSPGCRPGPDTSLL